MKDPNIGIQAVIDFVNQPGDDIHWGNTLLIVHSDHSNSRMRDKARMAACDLSTQSGVGSCGYGGPPAPIPTAR